MSALVKVGWPARDSFHRSALPLLAQVKNPSLLLQLQKALGNRPGTSGWRGGMHQQRLFHAVQQAYKVVCCPCTAAGISVNPELDWNSWHRIARHGVYQLGSAQPGPQPAYSQALSLAERLNSKFICGVLLKPWALLARRL